MAKAPINIKIEGDYTDRDIKRAMRDLESLKKDAGGTQQEFGKMSKGMKMAGIAVAAAAAGMAAAVGKFAISSISAASDLDESQSKVTQVFKDQADEVLAWADSSATAFGQSKQQALEAAGTYGNLFQAFGIASDAAQEMSTTMVELAADLASFNNTSIDDAIQALRSGLSGETEPLKRFGIALTDARLKAEAMAQGIYDGAGALDAGQKAQAAYAVILQDTTLAQGDFARTSDGLANTQRILQAAVEDAKAEIGTGLVNAITDIVAIMGGPQGMADQIDGVAGKLGTMTVGMGAVVRQVVVFNRNLAIATSGLFDFATAARISLAIATAGISETLLGVARSLYEIGEAEMEAQETTEAWADYRRAQQGVVDATPALVGALDDTSAAAANTAKSAAVAARALLEAAIATGQVPSAARFAQRFDVAAMLDGIGKAAASTGSSARSAGKAVDTLSARVEAARDRANAAIKDMRQKLRQELENSRQEFNDYAASVSQSIRGAISFADAAPEFDEQGNRVGLSFIEALQAQASKAQEFATKVKTLIAMGLSQDALQQVLAAGVTAGTNIANELITGGATTIEQTNELVATTQAAADEVGLEAAQSFYGAGVKTAQDTYEGFKANFGKGGPARKALMGVMDDLARKAARDVRIDVAVTRSINEVVTRVVQTISAPEPRALGGPVDAGSPYLIGERGPELFVPEVSGTVISNADMRSGGGTPVSGGVTLNVYAGLGTDGRQVGRQIVEALKQYERSNGPVPIKVA